MIRRTLIVLALGLSQLFFSSQAIAQTDHYTQFWNEFAFTRSLKGKWVAELNLGQTWTSPANSGNAFYVNSQLYARGWIHYYASARWKLSAFYAYYYNRSVPEINQQELPELRSAFQGTYYIRKIGYTLLTRFRIEDRKIKSNDGEYEASYRFRAQIKTVIPLNSKTIRKGVFYGFGSDELFFKTGALLTGNQLFDRNRLTIGGGYAFTDDFQLELSYANEFLPRGDHNELYNAFQVNFSINNFLPRLKKMISTRRDTREND